MTKIISVLFIDSQYTVDNKNYPPGWTFRDSGTGGRHLTLTCNSIAPNYEPEPQQTKVSACDLHVTATDLEKSPSYIFRQRDAELTLLEFRRFLKMHPFSRGQLRIYWLLFLERVMYSSLTYLHTCQLPAVTAENIISGYSVSRHFFYSNIRIKKTKKIY